MNGFEAINGLAATDALRRDCRDADGTVLVVVGNAAGPLNADEPHCITHAHQIP